MDLMPHSSYEVLTRVIHSPEYPQQCECKRTENRKYSFPAKDWNDAARLTQESLRNEFPNLEVEIYIDSIEYFAKTWESLGELEF